MRKVDYEYNIFQQENGLWIVSQFNLISELHELSPQMQNRQECYAWIEQQERENEQ